MTTDEVYNKNISNTNEEILANFALSMLMLRQEISTRINAIQPTLGVKIREVITKTYREIWNMLQRKKGDEYSALSIFEVETFKLHNYEFKKIIIDKCAPIIYDASIKNLGIDFDLLPDKDDIINAINRFVDTLFLYTVFLLKEEQKGNDIENEYIHDICVFIENDDNLNTDGYILDVYEKILFSRKNIGDNSDIKLKNKPSPQKVEDLQVKTNEFNRKYFYHISIILLLLALGDLPYGYYSFLRIFICITSIYTLIKHKLSTIYFYSWLSIAAIYNPIIKLSFDKEVWMIINIVTSIYIVYYLGTQVIKKNIKNHIISK